MANKRLVYVSYLIAILLVFLGKMAHAQKLQGKTEVIAIVLEKLIENTESTIDYNDLQSQLEYIYDHKIILNNATDDDLRQLIFLKQTDVLSILKHKKLYGNFESIYELQAIENLSDENIYFLEILI